ncbi:MAG TPA: phosphatidylglycerophosphatase A [Nitrolancea sp.]|jgi:phosphatidylglycerophosphatase A|nr:phosphatidylglycerophosphatase A [Nitrolancea sp.]
MAKSQTEAIEPRSTAPPWATLVATFFGAGRLRPGPGTWGSLATGLLWWLIASHISPAARLPLILALLVLVVAIGIPAATLEARGSGKKDPSHVVIDEVAGQLLTYIACPIVWPALLAGFILFRVFDILKPPPVRSLERLPEGTGIVVDDLGAGVYALIVLQLLLHFGVLR